MTSIVARRSLVLLAVATIVALALAIVPAPPPAGAAKDPSGPRAVAHHAGGQKITDPRMTSKAPDPEYLSIGEESAEPTLGVTKKGHIFTSALKSNARVNVLRSKDGGKTWKDVSPKLPNGRNAQLISFDPYTWLDPDTERVYTIDLTVACSYLSFTDDGGENWITNPLACGRPVNDHQTLFSGPPALSVPVGYDNVVYYCWNDIASSSCSRSLDGGISFAPTGSPAFPGVDPANEGARTCGGLHGHGHVGRDGTVFLPRGYCGQPYVAISRDEGATWERVQVAGNGISHHEASVATDKKGNVYYSWVARDRRPYLAISRDGGAKWSKPMMIGPPGLKESNLPSLDVGGPGKVAITYMGSTNSPFKPGEDEQCESTALTSCQDDRYDKTTWNAYMTISANALARKPVFYTGSINDPKDPMKRRLCGPGRCGTTIYDFIDVVISPSGQAWGAYVDACLLICPSMGPNDAGNLGVIGTMVGGPKLN